MIYKGNAVGKHIFTRFDDELLHIRDQVLKMGDQVEKQIDFALTALENKDAVLAKTVREKDKEINKFEIKIDEACVRIIATRQPTASDLRLVMTIQKVIAELERIGDVADRIGRTALHTFPEEAQPIVDKIILLGRHTLLMLHDVLKAFKAMNLNEALRIYCEDKKVDQEYNAIEALLTDYLTSHNEIPPSILSALFCARSIERIGDRCQNICEFMFYFVQGKDLRHQGSEKLKKILSRDDQ